MQPRVICISRAIGAGGEAVGQSVATSLGFRYVDEEIVSRAAAKLDVAEDLVAGVEERRSLVRRLLNELHDSGALQVYGFAHTPLPAQAARSDDYRDLIQQTIHETADQGDVVIVSHAASIALAGRQEIVRVLITGSPETRAGRLAKEGALEGAEAARLVKEGDLARAEYFRRFYHIDQELPTHYDVVINTDSLGVEDAARLVLAASGR